MRRMLLLACAIVLVAGTAFAASGIELGKTGPPTPQPVRATDDDALSGGPGQEVSAHHAATYGERRDRRRHQRHRAFSAMHERVLHDLAERLDAEPAELRTALRSAVRGARAKGMERSQLDERKAEVLADVGAALDRPAADVGAAIRAEAAQKLEDAVTFGLVTARGRRLALACYDAPDECDFHALRRESRFGRHGR